MINHRSWKHWVLSICLVFAMGQTQAQEAPFGQPLGAPGLAAPMPYGQAPQGAYPQAANVAPAQYPPAAYGAPMGYGMPPGMGMGGMPPGMGMGGMPPGMGMGGMPPGMGMGGMQMDMMGPMGGGIQPAYYGAPLGGEMGAGSDDFRFDFLRYLRPDPSGGCCAPRWFDIHMELMNVSREEVSDTIDFTSLGLTGANIVLSTDDLEFNARNGMRFSAAVQLKGGRNLEFSYFGLLDWSDQAVATDATNNLFSIISNYGTSPAGGFAQTDQSSLHRIEYSSSLDNFELGLRSRWTGPNCVLQGSWMAGVRYMYLLEDFLYHTEGPGGFMDYDVATRNSLTGGQIGGDLWVCIVPGVKFGVEVKGGVFGNAAAQNTNIAADSLTTPIVEQVTTTKAAFALEVGVMFIYKINQNLTLRGGYQSMMIDGVALAPENFNATPPNVFFPPASGSSSRVPGIDATGDVLYHGFTIGMEWMW